MPESVAKSIFISYRRSNGGIAYAYILNERLCALGLNCFFDIATLSANPGDYWQSIKQEIHTADYVILLIRQGDIAERKGKDIYLSEIREARRCHIPILVVPLCENFLWENESDIPEDLTAEPEDIRRLQLSPFFDLNNTEGFVESLLKMMHSAKNDFSHYLLVHDVQKNAVRSSSYSRLIMTNDMYCINMERRWANAKRISVLAIGCGYIVESEYPLVARLANHGTEFRILTIDPFSKTSQDMTRSKYNVVNSSSKKGYLKRKYQLIKTTFAQLANDPAFKGKLSYRVTREAITCTMQWIECECAAESYVYVEFLPINAIGTRQSENRAVVLTPQNSAYQHYVMQFERCWNNAKEVSTYG